MFKSSVQGASVAVGVFVALTLWSSSRAVACTCALLTAEEKATSADAVFLGEVEFVGLGIEALCPSPSWLEHRVNFRVIEAWKGLTGTHVGVTTGMGGGDCGAWGAVGEQVLVFGYACESEIQMSICGNVNNPSNMEAEQGELEQLGYEPLALTEGPDSQWPAYATGGCGLGLLPFLMMTMLGIACLRGVSSARR